MAFQRDLVYLKRNCTDVHLINDSKMHMNNFLVRINGKIIMRRYSIKTYQTCQVILLDTELF